VPLKVLTLLLQVCDRALKHLDFNEPRVHSYEQALLVIRHVSANPSHDLEQQFRRAVFNVIGRNQDDHTKNIGFLMDKRGQWNLSPAFDIAYSYNPKGDWTSSHQMLINGKSDDFLLADLLALGSQAHLPTAKAKEIIQQVVEIFSKWGEYAVQAGVLGDHQQRIGQTLRLKGWD